MRSKDTLSTLDDCSAESLYPILLSHVTEIFFYAGGAKGRVVPKILAFLQKEHGLPKTFKVVHGISVGTFLAMAVMLGFTPEKMSHTLSQMPVDSFKHRTLKRSIKFIVSAIGYLFPKFGNKLRNTFEWAYYDARGIREYFRRQITLNVDPAWKDRENVDNWLKKPIEERLDPTFKEVYDRKKVLLKVHVTNANTNKTMIYSAETTPDVPMSFAMMASASIPGIYPPVALDNEEKDLAWDGGMSERMSNATIPYYDQLHLHLMTPQGARVYFEDSEPIKINSFNDAATAAIGDMYNSQYLNLSEKKKQASLAIVVPLNTLKYNITKTEQLKLESAALEGIIPIYGIKHQLKVMAEKIIERVHKKRENIAQQLALEQKICLTFACEESFQQVLESFRKVDGLKIINAQKKDSENLWELTYQKFSAAHSLPKTQALLTWYREIGKISALKEKEKTEQALIAQERAHRCI